MAASSTRSYRERRSATISTQPSMDPSVPTRPGRARKVSWDGVGVLYDTLPRSLTCTGAKLKLCDNVNLELPPGKTSARYRGVHTEPTQWRWRLHQEWLGLPCTSESVT